jgi:hypothetical protein
MTMRQATNIGPIQYFTLELSPLVSEEGGLVGWGVAEAEPGRGNIVALMLLGVAEG